MKTREQALADVGRVVADELNAISGMTPQQIAQRAYHPAGPSVETLTAEFTPTTTAAAA